MKRINDEVHLHEKEWARIVQLIEGEWSIDEAEIIEWIGDDNHHNWDDSWSTWRPPTRK